ncbi:hypothetical protein GCM10022405_10270 [Gibbsiella dentisursi]|uniref:Uncharacterized protein n=1 Tax=Gibbsiella dentisursi TaxID=796890 RepID=A0ABP7KTF5_9GAMM
MTFSGFIVLNSCFNVKYQRLGRFFSYQLSFVISQKKIGMVSTLDRDACCTEGKQANDAECNAGSCTSSGVFSLKAVTYGLDS